MSRRLWHIGALSLDVTEAMALDTRPSKAATISAFFAAALVSLITAILIIFSCPFHRRGAEGAELRKEQHRDSLRPGVFAVKELYNL